MTEEADEIAALRAGLQQRLRPPWAQRLRRSPLTYTLALSLVFHLSMVTLFNVVVYFPEEGAGYYALGLISEAPVETPQIALVSSTLHSPLDSSGQLQITGLEARLRDRPSIELPTLEFGELQRLRLSQEDTEPAPPAYGQLSEQPQDLWAQMIRGATWVGRTLRGREPALPQPEGQILRYRPAEGFEAELIWSSAPFDRKLLLSPPIAALRELDPALLDRPVQFVISVDAQGRVTLVYSPRIDLGPALEDVQAAISKYRFDPLGVDADPKAVSQGTIYIKPAA